MGKYHTVFLAEKHSQVEALAKVLNARMTGKFKPAFNDEKGVVIVPLKGHVLVGLEPKEYDPKFGSFSEEAIYVFPDKRKLKPSPYAKEILNTAVKYIKDADRVIVATDYDAEGAAIAYNVLEYAGALDKFERMIPMGSLHEKELQRVIFNPKKSDYVPFHNLAKAGRLRAFIDWVEGMSLSRALTYYLGNRGRMKLLFGGVKAPIIYILVLREQERLGHKKTYYWTIKCVLETADGSRFSGVVKRKDENGKWTEKFESESEAKKALESLQKRGTLKVERIDRKNASTQPPQLYILSTLQADMADKRKIKPSDTMSIAQKLYDFPIAIQTYPRTDIPYLKSSEFEDVPEILNFVKDAGIVDGDIIDGILSKPIPKRKSVFNDEEVSAHGAIIPTKSDEIPQKFQTLSDLEKFEFSLVAKRYVAAFMEDYKYLSVSGKTEDVDGYAVFFNEHVPVSAGWKKLYEKDIESRISNYKREIPESLKKGDILSVGDFKIEQKETKPKPFYTYKSLLEVLSNVTRLFPDNEDVKKYLKENGIGMPSTRSAILDQLMDPKFNKGEPYIVEKDGKLRPTRKAIEYIKALPLDIVSPIKRALLNKKLKMVESGKIDDEAIIDEYREEVKKNIEVIKKIFEEKGPLIGADAGKEEKNPLGPCPACKKGQIVESKKIFMCSEAKFKKEGDKFINEGCDYKIFKNSLQKLGKSNIIAKEVSKMLRDGKCRVTLKSQKTGKSYQALMVPDLRWGVKIEFEQQKR